MILMNDFKSEPEELKKEELAAVDRVIRSGWYILGNEVKDFQEQWAKYCEVTNVVGVGNGMDAIEIGLRALDIGEGDEVITTPMTAFATVLAIIRAGATPVLADIDPQTGLLDLMSVERCIGKSTKAIILVHIYGQISHMDNWVNLCKKYNIDLVEDCAQSHLAKWNGQPAGGFGRFGAYSFYPTKNLGALGDAGALVTNEQSLATKAAILRNYGQSVRYHHPEIGLNSRLDELQAALLLVRLNWLEEFTDRRRQIAGMFYKGMENPLIKPMKKPDQPESHVYHLFVITCDERDRLAKYLKERDIETFVHYPVPIHFQESCKDIKRDPNGLPASELHAESCLSIPCHPQMNDADVLTVIDAINAFK